MKPNKNVRMKREKRDKVNYVKVVRVKSRKKRRCGRVRWCFMNLVAGGIKVYIFLQENLRE